MSTPWSARCGTSCRRRPEVAERPGYPCAPAGRRRCKEAADSRGWTRMLSLRMPRRRCWHGSFAGAHRRATDCSARGEDPRWALNGITHARAESARTDRSSVSQLMGRIAPGASDAPHRSPPTDTNALRAGRRPGSRAGRPRRRARNRPPACRRRPPSARRPAGLPCRPMYSRRRC